MSVIHLNQQCRVRLNAHGVVAMKVYYDSIRQHCPDAGIHSPGDVVTMTVWQFAAIFGPGLSMTQPQPIDGPIEMLAWPD